MGSRPGKQSHRRKTRPLTHNPVTRLFWLNAALGRQGNRCHYCGRLMSKGYNGRSPRLEHIVPISKGGQDVETNTLAACDSCDRMKGAMWPEDFVAMFGEKWFVGVPAEAPVPDNEEDGIC